LIGGNATYLDGGYLLFARQDGTINAVRFDANRLRVIGEPVQVLDNVAVKSGGAAELALAENGTLAYIRGNIGTQVVEFDRHGAKRLLMETVRSYTALRISPDGRRLALSVGEPYASDIWLYDIRATTLTKLSTFGNSNLPEWTPDGRRVAWTSAAQGHKGIWWRPWDQSAPAELLVPAARGSVFLPSGAFVLTSFDAPNGADIRMVTLPFDPRRPSRVILPAAPVDRQISLSPDGQWLAYLSDETGTRELYVQRIPGPGARLQVSVGGATGPRWSPNGKELFYAIPACCMMSATIATTPELSVVRRDSLFRVRGIRSIVVPTPDGNHYVATLADFGTVSGPILVFGWADEVRERVTAAAKR
jgi:dipeptidyl aminopeptidase/acylaminoacyl peptidase